MWRALGSRARNHPQRANHDTRLAAGEPSDAKGARLGSFRSTLLGQWQLGLDLGEVLYAGVKQDLET